MTIKKISVIAVTITMVFMLGSCWSYRNLSDMSIVTGVAIDIPEDSEDYKLTFEILDFTKPIREVGINTKLVISEGKTFYEATRNAKNKHRGELRFGHLQTAIISEEIAKNGRLLHIVDFMLRDMDFRETLNIVVSQAPCASAIFNTQKVEPIISLNIGHIVKHNKKEISSAPDNQLYDVFAKLSSGRTSPTLPAIHIVEDDSGKLFEISGTAVFKGENLVGYLNPQESKFFLFATDKVDGGVLTIPSKANDKDDTTLSIISNKTKSSYSYEDNKPKIRLELKTTVFLEEASPPLDSLDKNQMTDLKNIAEQELIQNIQAVIKRVQNEFKSDIFGFSDMIYKKDPKLWSKLSDKWDETFENLSVEIEADINIDNTSSVKKTKGK